MSARPPTRGLGRFMGAPGGKSFAEALRRAELAAEVMADDGLAEIEKTINRLDALVRAHPGEPAPEIKQEMAKCAHFVVSISGFVDRPVLGLAARSLFSLLDEFLVNGNWSAEAVSVHAGALRLLNGKVRLGPEEEKGVLAGLSRVTKRFLPEPAPPTKAPPGPDRK